MGLIRRIRGLQSAYHVLPQSNQCDPLNVQIVVPEALLSGLTSGGYPVDVIEPLAKCRVVRICSDWKDVDRSGCIHATVTITDASEFTDATADMGDELEDDEPDIKAPTDSDVASVKPASFSTTCIIFLHLANRINISDEERRAQERLSQVIASSRDLQSEIAQPGYLEKVPMRKRLFDEKKLHELNTERQCLEEMLFSLNDMLRETSVNHPLAKMVDQLCPPTTAASPLPPDLLPLSHSHNPHAWLEWRCASQPSLLGDSQLSTRCLVKQWLSWSLHVTDRSLSQGDANEYKAYCQHMVSCLLSLDLEQQFYLAGTGTPTLADMAAVHCLQSREKSCRCIQQFPDAARESVTGWLARLTRHYIDHPRISSFFAIEV